MSGRPHTNGPWVARAINTGRGLTYAVGREEIGPEHTLARVLAPAGRPTGTAESNAHMMAAAPELYDVANDVFDFLGGVDGAAEIRGKLLAAIQKAEGRP